MVSDLLSKCIYKKYYAKKETINKKLKIFLMDNLCRYYYVSLQCTDNGQRGFIPWKGMKSYLWTENSSYCPWACGDGGGGGGGDQSNDPDPPHTSRGGRPASTHSRISPQPHRFASSLVRQHAVRSTYPSPPCRPSLYFAADPCSVVPLFPHLRPFVAAIFRDRHRHGSARGGPPRGRRLRV